MKYKIFSWFDLGQHLNREGSLVLAISSRAAKKGFQKCGRYSLPHIFGI